MFTGVGTDEHDRVPTDELAVDAVADADDLRLVRSQVRNARVERELERVAASPESLV